MKLKLYIPTCDRYNWLIKPFSYTFNKFWDENIEVVYLGYTKPDFELPKNFEFVSLGNNDSLDNWSKDLRNYFNSIDDEWLMMTVDDSMLTSTTNVKLYNTALDYLLTTDKKVGRFGLERDLVTRQHQYWDTHKSLNLVEAKIEASHRISMRWSIWKKEYLIQHFTDGRTPWTFEEEGTMDSKRDGWGIISYSKTNPPNPPDNTVVFNTNALWRNWYKDYGRFNIMDCAHEDPYKKLDDETIDEMKKLNYFPQGTEFGSIYNKKWYKVRV
jgi:hypothetical protein